MPLYFSVKADRPDVNEVVLTLEALLQSLAHGQDNKNEGTSQCDSKDSTLDVSVVHDDTCVAVMAGFQVPPQNHRRIHVPQVHCFSAINEEVLPLEQDNKNEGTSQCDSKDSTLDVSVVQDDSCVAVMAGVSGATPKS